MKNIVFIFILMIFMGCGSSDSGDSVSIGTVSNQDLLENSDYLGVVNNLEGIASTDEEYSQLATAYLGLAGLSVGEIMSGIYTVDDTDDNSFMEFTNYIYQQTKNSDEPLEYLNKSSDYYLKISGDSCSQYNERTLSDDEKRNCLYKGLSQLVETVTAISYLTEDVRNLISGEDDNRLTTASCAMQYAFNGNSDCSFFKKEGLTFADGVSYDRVTIYSNHEEYQYLLSEQKLLGIELGVKNVVLTHGYCTLDSFSTRVKDKDSVGYDASTYYVCPINLTADDELVKSLNEGIEAIIVGANGDDDLIENSKKFKEEILNREYERDDDLTMSTFLKYLDKYTD